jgi:ribonuclease HI
MLQRNKKNEELFNLVDRALNWIKVNQWPNKILKWETEHWGEIPADFGRK